MSALTNVAGACGVTYDHISGGNGPGGLSTSVIDASTEKFAMLGHVWHPSRAATFKIRKVGFRTGTVTLNAASVVRVSLQDPSLTAGPPYQPDGTQDQTYDFGSGLPAANSWVWTGALSADRTVAHGELVAAVVEYQTFNASDVVQIAYVGQTAGSNLQFGHLGGMPLLNTGSWAAVGSAMANVAFECDDGSYAFMLCNPCVSVAFSTVSVATNVTARAAGNKFTVPVECKVEALGLMMSTPNGADGSLILYDGDGTTALLTIPIDNDAMAATGAGRYLLAKFPPITLQPSTNYRFVFVPSTTTAVAMTYFDVASAGLLDGYVLGQTCCWSQRDSGGAWAETTTRRALFAIGISAMHDGAGGGSGGPLGVNLRGGFVN